MMIYEQFYVYTFILNSPHLKPWNILGLSLKILQKSKVQHLEYRKHKMYTYPNNNKYVYYISVFSSFPTINRYKVIRSKY